MERKAYPVDKKLFYLLVEENFEKLNIKDWGWKIQIRFFNTLLRAWLFIEVY